MKLGNFGHILTEQRFPPTNQPKDVATIISRTNTQALERSNGGHRSRNRAVVAWRLSPSYLGRVDPSPDTNRVHLNQHEVRLQYAGPVGGIEKNIGRFRHCVACLPRLDAYIDGKIPVFTLFPVVEPLTLVVSISPTAI